LHFSAGRINVRCFAYQPRLWFPVELPASRERGLSPLVWGISRSRTAGVLPEGRRQLHHCRSRRFHSSASVVFIIPAERRHQLLPHSFLVGAAVIEVSGGCLLRSHRLGEFRQQTSSSTEKRAVAAGSRDRSFTEGESCGAVPIDLNKSRDAAAGGIMRPGRWICQLGHRAGVCTRAAVSPVLTQFFSIRDPFFDWIQNPLYFTFYSFLPLLFYMYNPTSFLSYSISLPFSYSYTYNYVCIYDSSCRHPNKQ
jgi:hypothetical protein